MKNIFQFIKESISAVMFPAVCVICGMSLGQSQKFICTFCAHNRFQKAVSTKEDLINLPEIVQGRFALWQFDKGGYLQDLLHKLKYHRLTGVGEDLGNILGDEFKKTNLFKSLTDELEILPVPLHSKKKRKRGFNQAFFIAKGIADVTGFNIIELGVVTRVKNTDTQTGFSLDKRRKNISNAFKVERPNKIEDKTILIVDDVFTTGATAFELVQELQKANVRKILIATVAQA